MSAFQGNVIKTMHISGILESNIRRFRTSNISIFCRVNECHCCIKCTRYLCKALKIAKKVLNLRGVSISFRSILFNYFTIYYKLTILVLYLVFFLIFSALCINRQEKKHIFITNVLKNPLWYIAFPSFLRNSSGNIKARHCVTTPNNNNNTIQKQYVCKYNVQ